MSSTAYDPENVLRLCRSCAERKGLSIRLPSTLCFECFRAERDCRRAQSLTDTPAAEQLSLHFAPRSLTPRATEHRRRMLAHLEATRAGR